MKIYIRHADKQYNNHSTEQYSHDANIKITEHNIIREVVQNLLFTHGCIIPDKIVCSPYLRTRNTAKIIVDELHNITGNKPRLSVDVYLSEFLNRNKHRYADVRPDTSRYGIVAPETVRMLYDRVNKIYNDSEDNVWYITHGSIVNQYAKLCGVVEEYPNYLDAFIHSNDRCQYARCIRVE